MDYVANKGESYLCKVKNGYDITGKLQNAAVFSSEQEVTEAITGMKRKKKLKGWKAKPLEYQEKKILGLDLTSNNESVVREETEIQKETVKKTDMSSGSFLQLLEEADKNKTVSTEHKGKQHTKINAVQIPSHEIEDEITEIANRFESKYKQYRKELSKVDKTIVDVYHLIEFSDYDENDWRSFGCYFLLRKLLRKRRILKDNLLKLEQLADVKEHTAMIIHNFQKIPDRTYTPRNMDSIFNEMASAMPRNSKVYRFRVKSGILAKKIAGKVSGQGRGC